MSDPDDRWERVAAALRARMAELRLSKAEVIRAAGVSDKTLKGYLEGQPIVRVDKQRGLCEALQWPSDAIDHLLEGRGPLATWEAALAAARTRVTECQQLADQAMSLCADASAREDAEAVARLDRAHQVAVHELHTVESEVVAYQTLLQHGGIPSPVRSKPPAFQVTASGAGSGDVLEQLRQEDPAEYDRIMRESADALTRARQRRLGGG